MTVDIVSGVENVVTHVAKLIGEIGADHPIDQTVESEADQEIAQEKERPRKIPTGLEIAIEADHDNGIGMPEVGPGHGPNGETAAAL